ncbi:transketolase family protein [Patescibacteria group bacterium]|nr:transketolase family protein [Patescibacteria group bacterium]
MINKSLKLNPKIFKKDVEKVPIRNGFGEGLVLAGENNSQVVGLCADLTESTKMNLFRDKFPDRFVEIGVAEQNLASVASGMAAMGKIPFISSYAMFSPGRNWEQIRTTICYNNRAVIIAGSHAGVSVGPDGGTHQAIEDIALTRVIPKMVVVSPCDYIEARKATLAVAEIGHPVYIRLAREKTAVITTDETPFELGRAVLFYGEEEVHADVGIIATGALVHRALLAAEALKLEGISAKVMNLATIKPLDVESVVNLARTTGCIVTVEEHQIMGGMGSLIAETLAENFPVPIEFIGVRDKFGQSGTQDELIGHYGMNQSHIILAAKKVIGRKSP